MNLVLAVPDLGPTNDGRHHSNIPLHANLVDELVGALRRWDLETGPIEPHKVGLPAALLRQNADAI